MSAGQMEDATLVMREVGRIEGQFFVASYQRGYRWGPHEVGRLLEDLWEAVEAEQPYSLQPVVVRRPTAGEWELVDGQQRLTTLYLLFLYMQRAGLKNVPPGYSIRYETREQSAAFLENPDPARAEENIDFFHLHGAYRCIADWFEALDPRARQFRADKLWGHLYEKVRVIWYETPTEVEPIALFTRLNVGRIPLTDAELVKALLLARARGDGSRGDRAHEVAAQWDWIERDLRRPELWAFVSETPPDEAPTRISLLLDALADVEAPPEPGKRPLFRTFDVLRARIEAGPDGWKAVWDRVVDLHARVVGWFEDRATFHKIGYLVSTGVRLDQLLRDAETRTKSALDAHLTELIRRSIGLAPSGVLELSYERHAKKLERLLLLANVETVTRMEHSSGRYSFHMHRAGSWSLEHIHAQNAEALVRVEQWLEWLQQHAEALRELPVADVPSRDALVAKLRSVGGKITREQFHALASEVEAMFGEAEAETSLHGVHSIANLALLDASANAALNNAVFEVKRRRILELDRQGAYLPECTRRVFLKYYTDAGAQQLHFWSSQDREAYLDALLDPERGVLAPYLLAEAES